jgi:hypothetical protein
MGISTSVVAKWKRLRLRCREEEYYWRKWLLPLLDEIVDRQFMPIYGLYPCTSHAILKFSRTTIYPFADENCPHALPIGDGVYRVFSPNYRMVYRARVKSTGREFDLRHPEYEVLGEGCTEETIRMLAEALPHNIATAVDIDADELYRLEGIGFTNVSDIQAHEAILYGDTEKLEECLRQGASVVASGPRGGTHLMCAVSFGHTEIVRLLLDHSANVYQENKGAENALAIARYEGKRHPDVLRLVEQAAQNVA